MISDTIDKNLEKNIFDNKINELKINTNDCF